MKLLRRLDEFLTGLSVSKFIIIITIDMIVSSIVLGAVCSVFSEVISTGTDTNLMKSSLVTQFIGAIIFAPLLETFLFQQCLIKILRKINILKDSKFKIVIISALIFGLQHSYDLGYVINSTVAGMFLSYAYITYEKKKISPFCVVCIIHSLRNFISFILVCIISA